MLGERRSPKRPTHARVRARDPRRVDTDVPPRLGPRHARTPAPRQHALLSPMRRHRQLPQRRRRSTVARAAATLVAILIVTITGIGWAGYHDIIGGITTSRALAGGPSSTGGDQNILIMGLDSRLDQHGRPLPQDIYDALHAGDETVGGYNANVLIVLHLPSDGGPITAISIPRDDYVDLAGCPGAECKGKIKQAYGLAYQRAVDRAAGIDPTQSTTVTAAPDPLTLEQTGREAGRKAQIDTVRRLLGIPIDHFIEVTLAAFFQIAQVVQPITVCVTADTADPYSGADFHQGHQQINAAQAMAFVRQRRDINDAAFTDMDRTRRQQAFIAALASALRRGGALSSPTALRNLLNVARQNVAVDAGFDVTGFLQHGAGFTDRALSLYTLPITEFGHTPDGADVNLIDVPTIRAITRNLLTMGAPGTATSSAPPITAPAVPAVLHAVNATTHPGLAAAVIATFAARGYTPGTASTAENLSATSSITYGPGAQGAAHTLADHLGLTATAADTLEPNTVHLSIGADFPTNDYLPPSGPAAADAATSPPAVTTVAATGTAAPAPTALSQMDAADTPCVK